MSRVIAYQSPSSRDRKCVVEVFFCSSLNDVLDFLKSSGVSIDDVDGGNIEENWYKSLGVDPGGMGWTGEVIDMISDIPLCYVEAGSRQDVERIMDELRELG